MAFRPSVPLRFCSAPLKLRVAASVQSARGSSKPPPLIEKISISDGMMATFASLGTPEKPGATLLSSAEAMPMPANQMLAAIQALEVLPMVLPPFSVNPTPVREP